jgi:hypothetical protein
MTDDQQHALTEQRTREAMAVELAALRADAERARWCEENKIDVVYICDRDRWAAIPFGQPPTRKSYMHGKTRNDAIDALRGAR